MARQPKKPVRISICDEQTCADWTILREQYIDATLKCFRLTDEERRQAKAAAVLEFEHRLPRFVECVTLAVLLPTIQDRAERYFKKKGMPPVDAETLAGILTDKVFNSLFGGWPRVNPGAMVRTYRANLHMDYRRAARRSEKRFGKRQSDFVLKNWHDKGTDEMALKHAIEDLPPRPRAIIERLWQGEDWAEIAEDLGTSVQELKFEIKKSIQRLRE